MENMIWARDMNPTRPVEFFAADLLSRELLNKVIYGRKSIVDLVTHHLQKI